MVVYKGFSPQNCLSQKLCHFDLRIVTEILVWFIKLCTEIYIHCGIKVFNKNQKKNKLVISKMKSLTRVYKNNYFYNKFYTHSTSQTCIYKYFLNVIVLTF